MAMEEADAFARFYEKEGEAVLIFLVRRTMQVETAVDLTAETFAVLLRSWGKVSRLAPEQARAWAFTVARRQHSHYLRRARVERRAVERLGIQVPTVTVDDLELIEERAGLKELRRALGLELGRLGVDQREAVLLRVVEERPYDEVARRLGVSEQTARARVSRGLRALTVALEPHYQAAEQIS
jgi:RNA polymerase sigma factor (sigma-70 family)